MSDRARFVAAAAGEQLAFVPTLWEEVDRLVRQPAAGWWRDPTAATRILADAAALAGADAQVVCGLDSAVAELEAAGVRGDEILDGLVDSAPARDAIGLVERLARSGDHAVVAALPDVVSLQRRLGGTDSDIADDAFSDVARACLEAGADALAVLGADAAAVRSAAARAAGLGEFYGRPVVGAILAGAASEGWVEGRPDVPVGFVAGAGTWPEQRVGIVLTPGDVSGRWDIDALRAVGAGRP